MQEFEKQRKYMLRAIELAKKGILTLSQAAEEAKMSPEEFQLKAAEQK